MEKPTKVSMTEEFRVCPSCNYRDGFHSAFVNEDGVIKWLFICPSCHQLFDIGFTARQAEQE